MSLLLEALKKAEKAKEDAQRRAQGGEAPEPSLIPAAPPPEPPPAEREPLQIVADEPTVLRSELPPLAMVEDKPRAAPKPKPEPAASAERAAARKVFEAKFKEPNPRLPFYITLGALGVFAVGTVVYFWMQLRPPAPLVNTSQQRPQAQAQVPSSPPEPPRAAAPTPPQAPSAIPGLPSAALAAPAAKPAAQRVTVTRPPEAPVLKPQPRLTAPVPRAPSPAPAEITSTRAVPQVHPKVASAYSAYVAGDFAAARADYQQALRDEPSNRDALLGLAALDVRAGRYGAAEGAYVRLLQADPRDAHAQAGLISLRAGRVDPVAAESRVKVMLADNPGAHVLNFTLGNQFAQQGRWAEAQQEYFKAFSAEPDNPDFAYNLAVSLDHLRQPKLALEYYRRALQLAKSRSPSFDSSAAETRAAQLGR